MLSRLKLTSRHAPKAANRLHLTNPNSSLSDQHHLEVLSQLSFGPDHIPSGVPRLTEVISTTTIRPRPTSNTSVTSLKRIRSLAKTVFSIPVSEISGRSDTAAQLQKLLNTVASLEVPHATPVGTQSHLPLGQALARNLVELVDPQTLSLSPFLGSPFEHSNRTSFIPPSPSWFCRNLHFIPPDQLTSTPAPLPIPPPLILPRPQPEIVVSQDDVSEHTLIGSSPSSDTATQLAPPSRHSFAFTTPPGSPQEDRVSVSPETTKSQCEIDPINHTRPTFDDCIAISPIATYPSPPTILLRPPTLVHDPKHSFPALFIPDYSSITDKPDLSALPIDLTLSLQNLFDHYLSKHAMDYTGKQTDVIDFGGETNYEGHAWFQNAPTPPPAPSQPATPARHYEPPAQVIMQNEGFEYALKVAPNVLYSRFKQYGQLGVLGWCSEFGEMIDHLKDLGFQGQMFVSTRTQALRTCEEILALKLPIEMQIVVIYLSSQVSRLRRFLDGDKVFDDYPEPQFPLDPSRYSHA